MSATAAFAHVLPYAELASVYGYERMSDVRRCLRRDGIRYFEGRNGPWTTLELVNAAGGLKPDASAGPRPYDATDLLEVA